MSKCLRKPKGRGQSGGVETASFRFEIDPETVAKHLAGYSDFLDLEVPREKPKNPKNYPKLASDSSGTLKIGFSVKFYIYI